MTHDELKEMVIILKENAFKSHNDTAILNVKVENFNYVMDKVLEVLDNPIGLQNKTNNWI
jgi:hypothetical protein